MPHARRLTLGTLGFIVLIAGVLLFFSAGDDRRAPSAPSASDGGRDQTPVAVDGPPELASEPPRRTTIELRRGDTLVRALARDGLAIRVISDVAAALRAAGADLKRLKPSDTLEVTWSLEGEPVRIAYDASPWLGFAAIARDGGGWRVERSETRPDVRLEVVAAEVTRSLWDAVEAAGERPALVPALVEIFDSDFDFTADTRPGDRFRLLVEKRFAGETFVDYGRILGAQYLSDGRLLTGVAFQASGSREPAYFDLSGHSLKKTFLKSPLEFSRITSGFTYARPHPILGGVRPHLAVDYAAPAGTPVRAVADGVVLSAGWAGGNGISVRLRHRNGYETMYNHLSRTAVRSGARVRQRQVIGYVGSTGLSTGPHLDYRVARNGVFVNPLRESFIPGEPVNSADRARLKEQLRTVVRRLESDAPF
jgi:murein DD-endopeptidase MepM/ murein hydrolase activator NlpD